MPFPLAAVLAGVGGALLSGRKTSQANKQQAYEVDQARRNYDAERVVTEEKDARRADSVEFLKAIAKARGYNIPDAAFAMLNARGPFKLPSAQERIIAPPKGNAWLDALFGGVGAGMKTYGALSGGAMASQPNVPTYDGAVQPFTPPSFEEDEFSFAGLPQPIKLPGRRG